MNIVLYAIKRTLSLLVSFFVVSLVVFIAMHSIPGGPFDPTEMPLSHATKELILHRWGLDKPLYVQYLRYMWGFIRGDFGIPYQSPGETVNSLLARAWPPSLLLGGLGMVLGTPIGMLLGIAAAVRRNSIIDYLASVVSTLGITVPIFVTSLLLLLTFNVWLHWLPGSGWGGPVHWILPVASYSIIPIATFARYTRSTMLDSMNKPFVVVLRSKGLSRWSVVMKHVLRNAAIPMITIFFPMFIGIATGTVFVEAIFRVPGLGKYFVTSITSRDYPTEMALVLVLTLLVGAAYLITDILYTILNPTIRLRSGRER